MSNTAHDDLKAVLLSGDIIKPSTVLVVGDFMLDTYIWGKTERISPEAPIPVVKVQSEMDYLGGAGNVVANLRGLGIDVLSTGIIGKDPVGEKICNHLAELGCSSNMLIEVSDRPTNQKTRVIAQAQQVVRFDREELTPLSKQVLDSLWKEVQAILDSGRTDVCVISDYGKGVCQPTLLQQVIAIARSKNVPVIVDPKNVNFGVYSQASCITPNLLETSKATSLKGTDDKAVADAAKKLRQSYKFENVLITRGVEGMTLLKNNGDMLHIPAEAREVFDVSGAGDTVVATLTAGLSWNLSYENAARLANIAAGVVVGKLGTTPIRLTELQQALDTNGINQSHAKVMKIDDLMRRLSVWRNQGKHIVFTNGCFDLLHLGHIILLEKAAELGDVLIVGLNTDASVSRLKGQGRPINKEGHRTLVLAGLASVDGVVLFDEDTPIEIIQKIRPDVLVKGADYQEKDVVGGAFVESYGGKVVLIPQVEGHSTTRLIDKMRQNTFSAKESIKR